MCLLYVCVCMCVWIEKWEKSELSQIWHWFDCGRRCCLPFTAKMLIRDICNHHRCPTWWRRTSTAFRHDRAWHRYLRVGTLKAAGRDEMYCGGREGKLGECVCLQFVCAQRGNSEVIVSCWLVADTATKQITCLFVRGRQTHARSSLPSSVCRHTQTLE